MPFLNIDRPRMRRTRGWRFAAALACAAAVLLPAAAAAAPPYSGTAFIAPALITDDDPTAFTALTDRGMGSRLLYDRRVGGYVTMDVFLYEATFSDGHVVEFQVNPEFGDVDAARQRAADYAPVIGRLPNVLRRHLAYVWVHAGDEPFGGTGFDGVHPAVLIHTGALAQSYVAQGVLEEILLHEATHAVLDADVANAPGWLSAQADDAEFISIYARDNPTSEDVAESFLTYLAACCGGDRVSAGLVAAVRSTIPARLRHFDSLSLDVRPLRDPEVIFRDAFDR
jgi:hypothetical protein